MPGYFDVLGMRVLEGRDFTEADRLGTHPVVIVSQRTAELLFANRSAVGREIRASANGRWVTVVGVLTNIRWNQAERRPGLELYWPYRQFPGPPMHLILRSDGDAEALVPSIRRTIQETNADIAIERIEALDTVAANSLWPRRLWAVVLSTFAALALTLAAIGLYAVKSIAGTVPSSGLARLEHSATSYRQSESAIWRQCRAGHVAGLIRA